MAKITIKFILEKWRKRNSVLIEAGIHSLLPPGGVKIKYLFESRQRGLGEGVGNDETDTKQTLSKHPYFICLSNNDRS